MSGLIILHKAYQEGEARFRRVEEHLKNHVWQTCRREILFLSAETSFDFSDYPDCEYFEGVEAEAFLIEILCGLKSPLIGETEVFGQFKNWWQNLSAIDFKKRFDSRIQCIFSTVKKIREENLCGIGAQSYGSLLRKKIETQNLGAEKISFIGAGQLTAEILPWLQEKWNCRIWCRRPESAGLAFKSLLSTEICRLNDLKSADSNLLVVAAPIAQNELEKWIAERFEFEKLTVYDFRHDSMHIRWQQKPSCHVHLNDLTNEFSTQKQILQTQAEKAFNQIKLWTLNESKRAQVRPFGWDDL